MRKLLGDWRLLLFLVTLLAIALRSIPAWLYSGWGNDFGIYYSITIEFLQKRNPLYEYPAFWGSSGYGSFPMFYLIIMGAYYLTGADPRILVLRVPPVIGGLTVIPLFLISYYLTKSRKTSLLAALLLAINPVQMYQTSMPYFLTIGHFFLLFSLYFFIRWKDDTKWLYFLIPSSVALLLSHHLSNYMFIISITGIWFVLSIFGKLERKMIYRYFLFILLFSGVTFTYWVLHVPGMKGFLSSLYHGALGWYYTVALYYVLMLTLFYLSLNMRLRLTGRIIRVVERWKVPWIFAISLGFGIVSFVLLSVIGLHGYYIPPVAILYSLPFLLTLGFMGVGLSRIYLNERLFYVLGAWTGAIAFSAFTGFVTWSGLLPWRHVEYLMEPLSIAGAMGIRLVMGSEVFKKVAIKKRMIVELESPSYIVSHGHNPEVSGGMIHPIPKQSSVTVRDPVEIKSTYPIGRSMQVLFISVIVFIVVMSGITAYPFMNKVSPPEQQVSDVVMSAVFYLQEYGDRNYTVATDHKVGMLVEAYGFNSSFEYDYKIWNSTTWIDCLDELEGLNGTYPPVGYVLITRNMLMNGVYGYGDLENPIAPPVMMNNTTYEKFQHEPFELIFKNSTPDNSDWVEIYRVNWTYIWNNLNYSRAPKNFESDYTPWYSHRDFLNFSISCSREFRRSLFTSFPAIFIMNSRDFK